MKLSRIVAGLPAVVPFVSPDELERELGYRFAVRVGANESAFGVSPKAVEAMARSVEKANWYGDPSNFELIEALAEKLDVDRDRLMVAGGIDELLGLAVRVLLDPGDVAVASHGSYATFAYHVGGFGARLETAPYDDFRNSADRLAEAANKHGARVVYLANPDNPTGTLLDVDEIRRLMEALPDNCVCFLDEAYSDFLKTEQMLPLGSYSDRIVRFRTFSKAHGMAGIRVGYLLGSPELVSAIQRIRLHFGVNRTAQAGALASLADDQFIAGVVGEVKEGREEYYSLGRELGVETVESWTNFVLFKMADEDEAKRVMDELTKRRVFVRTARGDGTRTGIRVTVGTAKERAGFAHELREILA